MHFCAPNQALQRCTPDEQRAVFYSAAFEGPNGPDPYRHTPTAWIFFGAHFRVHLPDEKRTVLYGTAFEGPTGPRSVSFFGVHHPTARMFFVANSSCDLNVYKCDAGGPHDFECLVSDLGTVGAIGQKFEGPECGPKNDKAPDVPQLRQGPVKA